MKTNFDNGALLFSFKDLCPDFCETWRFLHGTHGLLLAPVTSQNIPPFSTSTFPIIRFRIKPPGPNRLNSPPFIPHNHSVQPAATIGWAHDLWCCVIAYAYSVHFCNWILLNVILLYILTQPSVCHRCAVTPHDQEPQIHQSAVGIERQRGLAFIIGFCGQCRGWQVEVCQIWPTKPVLPVIRLAGH